MSSFNNTAPSCTNAPEVASTDAGIAGAGILLAFIITAFLAIFLSAWIIFSEIRARSSRNISRKILSGLSDQMIVEGIAIQVVGLARIRTMIPYHFFIVWMLAVLSTATNFASLLALVQDFKRDWVLRWLRQFAMFVNLALTVVFGVFVLRSNMNNLAPTLPVWCVWEEHDVVETGESALSLAGTIAVIAASGIIFIASTWYLHRPNIGWGKSVRVVCLIVLMAIAIGATVRIIIISQAFGEPSVSLADNGEQQWSFGQLLTMLLLILPFVSALEILRGETSVPRAKTCPDDQIPLTRNDEEYKPERGYQILKCASMQLGGVAASANSNDVFQESSRALLEERDIRGLVDGLIEGLLPEAWRDDKQEEVDRIRSANATTVEGFVTCCGALSSLTFDLRPKMAGLVDGVDEACFTAEPTDYDRHDIIELLHTVAESAFAEAGPNKQLIRHFRFGFGPAMFLSNAEGFAWLVRERVGGQWFFGAASPD